MAPGSTTPNWPVVPFEVVRQRTLDFLNTSHAQAAINVHFFAPFPVPGGSTQGAYGYVIGLAGSRGKVYSGFESPIQSYAIVTNSPGLNIDESNNASIVHRDPASADGMDVLENVELWNALAGSGQILTNGVKTILEHWTPPTPTSSSPPARCLARPAAAHITRAGRHCDLSNARTAIGVTEDGRTLVLFTVDGTNGGHGMQVGEVADLLKNDYGVWNALNLDGGGSTTMASKPRDARAEARERARRKPAAPGGEQLGPLLGRRRSGHRGHRRPAAERERLEPGRRRREPRSDRPRERSE